MLAGAIIAGSSIVAMARGNFDEIHPGGYTIVYGCNTYDDNCRLNVFMNSSFEMEMQISGTAFSDWGNADVGCYTSRGYNMDKTVYDEIGFYKLESMVEGWTMDGDYDYSPMYRDF